MRPTRRNVQFIEDGTFITSVEGACSYELDLHLVDQLRGSKTAHGIASGLVLPWNPVDIPTAVVQ